VAGYKSVDDYVCVREKAGGDVGQRCFDYGYQGDPNFGQPGFDPTKSCESELVQFCNSPNSAMRTAARTQCPVTSTSTVRQT
jgi:hypothetical protein